MNISRSGLLAITCLAVLLPGFVPVERTLIRILNAESAAVMRLIRSRQTREQPPRAPAPSLRRRPGRPAFA